MVKSKHLSSDAYDVRAKSSDCHPKLSSQERHRISGEDRISNLPQPLIHHILSKLPSEDAMQTMLLSKSWKDEWITSPCLDLTKEKGHTYFANTQLRNIYLDFAFRILTRRYDLNCLSIERLHLFLPNSLGTSRTRSGKRVDNLFCYAVTTFVIHELTLSSYSEPFKYRLSKDIIPYIHSLTNLTFKHLKLDQQTIATLAFKCPLLKSLELRFCDLIDMKLRVSGFHKLVNLSVECVNIPSATSKGDAVKVEIIDAPSLVKFRYSGVGVYFGLCPNDVISGSSCKGLKHLELTNVLFDQSSFNLVLSHLPSLQHLNLSCKFLWHQRLDICSPSLEHLELRLLELVEQLHIDAPNLAELVYTYDAKYAQPIIFPFNAAFFNPEKVTIDIINFHTRIEKDNLPCFRGLHSPVYDFKHVVLNFKVWDVCLCLFEPARSRVLFTAILDPALCLFPNLRTCIISPLRELVELKLEFKYKGSEVHGCWQQRLHEVKIENIGGANLNLTSLSNCFDEAIKANKVVV